MEIRRRAFLLGAGAAIASAPAFSNRALSWLTQEKIVDTWNDAATGTAPPLSAPYAFVRNITTRKNLFTKAHTTVCSSNQAASTTKMALAVIAVRELAYGVVTLDTTHTVNSTESAITGTSANLETNDVITLRGLLYGMLLPSGNDAAYCVARLIGTAIYTRTGSGTTGVTRSLEAMNALTTELGMANTTYTAPDGVNVAGNVTTASDLARLTFAAFENTATQALSNPSLNEISLTPEYLITITGVNARTYTVYTTNVLIGPTPDVGVVAAKTGAIGTNQSMGLLWQAPNGHRLIITVIGSYATSEVRSLDIKGLIYEAMLQFAWLKGITPSFDSDWASVLFLSGADPGFTDESSIGRTLTNVDATRVTTGPPIGSHSYSFNGTTANISAPDAADLSMGTSDFCIEFWFRGNGSAQSTHAVFVSKYDAHTSNTHREYSVQFDITTPAIQLYVSADGTAFVNARYALTNTDTNAVLFNGALHHVLARRYGNLFDVYLDGVKGDVTLNSSISLYSGNSKLMLGARQSNVTGILYPMNVRLDEVRITKGAARQTATKFLPIPYALPRSGTG